jgi:hypothetical protein
MLSPDLIDTETSLAAADIAGSADLHVSDPDTDAAIGRVLRWHTVKTHGGMPARFQGERILQMRSCTTDPVMETHEIELFQTDTDCFVVSVSQLSFDGKRRSLSVFEAADARAIREHVAGLDPLHGLPIPKAIIESSSIDDILTAHALLAKRVSILRKDFRDLCDLAFVAPG